MLCTVESGVFLFVITYHKNTGSVFRRKKHINPIKVLIRFHWLSGHPCSVLIYHIYPFLSLSLCRSTVSFRPSYSIFSLPYPHPPFLSILSFSLSLFLSLYANGPHIQKRTWLTFLHSTVDTILFLHKNILLKIFGKLIAPQTQTVYCTACSGINFRRFISLSHRQWPNKCGGVLRELFIWT